MSVSHSIEIARFSRMNTASQTVSSVKHVPMSSHNVFIRTSLSRVSQRYLNTKFTKKMEEYTDCHEREVYLQIHLTGFLICDCRARMHFNNDARLYCIAYCYLIISLGGDTKETGHGCFHYIECIRREWYESRRGERISDNVNSAKGKESAVNSLNGMQQRAPLCIRSLIRVPT